MKTLSSGQPGRRPSGPYNSVLAPYQDVISRMIDVEKRPYREVLQYLRERHQMRVDISTLYYFHLVRPSRTKSGKLPPPPSGSPLANALDIRSTRQPEIPDAQDTPPTSEASATDWTYDPTKKLNSPDPK